MLIILPKCIYREVGLNSNSPIDSDTQSIEHIIPWALGGTNGLTTPDASTKANNDLGSEVDAPFSDTLPLAIKRHQLQLEGQGGTIPPIVWRGESADGVAGTLTIFPDGRAECTLEKSVERPAHGQSGPVLVTGSRADLEPILTGMLKGMKKRNEKAYSQDGRLLESLEDFWAASQQKMVEQLKLRVDYFNQEAWTRGVLKIALSAGHKLLNEEWTFGPTAALIRQIVTHPRAQWQQAPRGFIAGEFDRSLRIALGKTSEVRDANKHTIAVLPADSTGNGVLAISLFGGDGVPESVIGIGKPKKDADGNPTPSDDRRLFLSFGRGADQNIRVLRIIADAARGEQMHRSYTKLDPNFHYDHRKSALQPRLDDTVRRSGQSAGASRKGRAAAIRIAGKHYQTAAKKRGIEAVRHIAGDRTEFERELKRIFSLADAYHKELVRRRRAQQQG